MKATTRHLERLFLLWSAVLLFSTASGHLHSPDGEVNYRTTRSLAIGTGYAISPMPDRQLTRRADDGKEYSQYGPLQPLLATPLHWIGRATAFFLPEPWLSAQAERLGSTVLFYRPNDKRWEKPFPGLYPKDHTERVCRIFVSHFNVLITWGTVYLLLLWSRRLFGFSLVGLVLPATYLLATWAWPHSKPFYTEALALFFILLASYLAAGLGEANRTEAGEGTSNRSILPHAAFVGGFAGLAVLARMDSVVAMPGIAWIACSRIASMKTEAGKRNMAAAIAAGFAAFVLISSIIPLQNFIRFGSPLATGYSDQPEGIRFSIPVLHSFWIYFLSPGKGIFGYSPPLLAALLVWPFFLRRERHLGVGVLLMVLGYVLVVGRWQNLGGQCWGPRHLFQINALLLLPLALLFHEGLGSSLRRVAFPVFAVTFVAGVFVQVCGVLVDYMWPLDRLLPAPSPLTVTERVLSAAFYGPVLHLQTWRLERLPDWFLADLWRSGETGARLLSGAVWIALLVLTAFLIRSLYRGLRAEVRS